MTASSLPTFDGFVAWLARQSGPLPEGCTSWPEVAKDASRRRGNLEAALMGYTGVQIEDPGDFMDFHRWSTARRLRWNLNALRAYRGAKEGAPTSRAVLARALRAYTGWGGFTRLLSQLSPGSGLFAPELEEAIVAWAEATRTGKPPSAALLSTEEAIRTQYFTPLAVCGVMWDYARRLVSGPIRNVLEPSAGIGRMIDATPLDNADARFYAVEYDTRLADMLSLRFQGREVQVHSSMFEAFRYQGQGFDLVISNPPFMDRSRKALALDRKDLDRAEHYSLIKSLKLLRPGGVLVTLTPVSLVQATSKEQMKFREEMLIQGDFRGAVMLPSEVFPDVPGIFCIQAWTRRSVNRPGVEARELSRVPYHFEQSNILGTYQEGYRGGSIIGTFDATVALGAVFRAADRTSVDFGVPFMVSSVPASATPTAAAIPKPVTPARPPPKRQRTDYRYHTVRLLGNRLFVYYQRLASPEKMTLAEVGRQELLIDLAECAAKWGDVSEVLADVGDQSRRGWEQYFRDGVQESPIVTVDEYPRNAEYLSPFDLVAYYCRLQGYCGEEDLQRHYPDAGEDLVFALIRAGIFIEPSEQGFRYFTEEHYLTGNLTDRLEVTSRVVEMAEVENPEVMERLKEGVTRLQSLLGAQNVLSVGVSPRSGIVPVATIAEWTKTFCGNSNFLLLFDGVRYNIMVKDEESPSPETALITLYEYESGGSSARARDSRAEAMRKAQKVKREGEVESAVHLLGYLNREEKVDIGASSQRQVFEGGIGFSGRVAQEKSIEAAFTGWLSLPENQSYLDEIEAIYTERMPQQRGRLYSTDPYPLARQNPDITLHAHQNQTVRWQRERVGGLIFDAVGAGKTFLSFSSLAMWRQTGRARRSIIVVPNNTLAQWYTQTLRFLPDYRVCLVGITAGKDDSQEVRAEKWQAFADGHYDVAICGHSGFLRDVFPNEEKSRQLLMNQAWIRRGLAQKLKLLAVVKRKLEEIEARLLIRPNDGDLRAEKVKLEKQIKDLTPTDRDLLAAAEEGSEKGKTNFRAENSANLISWEAILSPETAIIVDEAHYYKNLWYPSPRLGASTIAFLGSTKKEKTSKKKGDVETVEAGKEVAQDAKQEDDGEGLTKLCWDLLFKTRELFEARGDGQGVMLMTATPLKNSPIELYNLGEYVSADLWPRMGIQHKEEFIDRYLEIGETNTAGVFDLTPKVGPGVLKFNEAPLRELLSSLAPLMQRRTKVDLTNAGILVLPNVDKQTLAVTMRDAQAEVSDALRTAMELRMARKTAGKEAAASGEWVDSIEDPELKEIAESLGNTEITEAMEAALTLISMSLLIKVAIDPRLVLLDYYDVKKVPEADRVLKRSKEKGDTERSEAADEAYAHLFDVMEACGLTLPDDLISDKLPEKLSTTVAQIVADNAERAAEGLPPFGTLIFLDSVEAHGWLTDALVAAGIPRERIKSITGSVDKTKRDEIANGKRNEKTGGWVHGGFNGAEEEINPVTLEKEQDAAPPAYDILIGTSRAMAEGLNLQKRTGSLYHLTYTWEPATIEQREGRAIRQGNTLSLVKIYNVVSSQSFDGILMNASQGKAEWQNEIFSGNAPNFQTDGSDREQMLIRFVVRNPERAEALFEEIRKKQKYQRRLSARRQAWTAVRNALNSIGIARQQENPKKKQEKLEGVRYALRNADTAMLSCIPEAALDGLMAGELVFPDLVSGVVYRDRGNLLRGKDGERKIYITQVYPGDTSFRMVYREEGRLALKTAVLYAPGYSVGGKGAVLPGEDPIDFSVRYPPNFPGGAYPDVPFYAESAEPMAWPDRAEFAETTPELVTIFQAFVETRRDVWHKRAAKAALIAWNRLAVEQAQAAVAKNAPVSDMGLLNSASGGVARSSYFAWAGAFVEGGHFRAIPSGIFLRLPDGKIAFCYAEENYYGYYNTAQKTFERVMQPKDDGDFTTIIESFESGNFEFWDGSGGKLFMPSTESEYQGQRVLGSFVWTLRKMWDRRLPRSVIERVLKAIPKWPNEKLKEAVYRLREAEEGERVGSLLLPRASGD